VSLDPVPWLGSEELLQFPNEGIAVVLPEPIQKARLLNLSLSRGVFCLFVLSAAAWAVDPHTLISQYGHTAWRMQDGFLSNPESTRPRFRLFRKRTEQDHEHRS
jgi:hypothetical protein